MSRVSNHINRNIERDQSGTDADIEILNINSPDYNTQDSEQHEASLNEAWRFINTARHQNFTQNEDTRRNYRDCDPNHMQDRDQFLHENTEANYVNRPNTRNTTWYKTSKNKKHERDLFFSNINDYLDALDKLSDEETQNEAEQNYFDIKNASNEAIEVYDGTICAVSNEGPMLIYSYKNKYYTSDANEVLINSPNQSSQSNSTGSISVENLNEESMNYEKSFYRISTFHPVIIPRLPLATYMLPTVTEILEPARQSPKITELSDEENASVKKKPTNSWVMNDDDSSHSDADRTTETNLENSADESSPDNKEQTLHSPNKYTINQHENDSKIDAKENMKNYTSKDLFDLHTKETFNPISSGDSTRTKHNEKEILKQRNNYLDAGDVIQVDLASKGFENDSRNSKHRNSSPIELLSKHSSIPTLHLSLNTEPDTNEQSWFKRFIQCILCCK